MALTASSRTAKHKGIHQDNSRSITATVARLHQPPVLANCFGTTIICNASWTWHQYWLIPINNIVWLCLIFQLIDTNTYSIHFHSKQQMKCNLANFLPVDSPFCCTKKVELAYFWVFTRRNHWMSETNWNYDQVGDHILLVSHGNGSRCIPGNSFILVKIPSGQKAKWWFKKHQFNVFSCLVRSDQHCLRTIPCLQKIAEAAPFCLCSFFKSYSTSRKKHSLSQSKVYVCLIMLVYIYIYTY